MSTGDQTLGERLAESATNRIELEVLTMDEYEWRMVRSIINEAIDNDEEVKRLVADKARAEQHLQTLADYLQTIGYDESRSDLCEAINAALAPADKTEGRKE